MNGEYNMRILICDDDLLIVEKLQKYLKSYFSHLHLSCPEIVCFSDRGVPACGSGRQGYPFSRYRDAGV